MDIHNSLKDICRGVEADILNYLAHHPHHTNATAISRAIRRSKSETIKCLHHLSDGGMISRAHNSGRQYGLDGSNAPGYFLLKFAQMPRMLADDLASQFRKFPHRDPSAYLSVTLAPEEWCIRLGLQNVVLVALGNGAELNPYLIHAMITTAERRFRAKIRLVTASPAELRHHLTRAGISTVQWPLSPATKGAQPIWGRDLLEVLSGAECGD